MAMGKQIAPKVFITGASGFIGKHLCDILKKKGMVFSSEKVDLLDKKTLQSFFEVNDFDTVVHLVGAFGDDFDHLLDVNVRTTWNLCSALINTRVKKIIYTSSGAVYGPPSNGVESYETDIPSPDSMYGLTKLFAEQIIAQFADCNERQSIILRLPNIYGPGGKGLINQMKNSIIYGHSVTVNGNGLKSRDIMHISDVVSSIFEVINHNFNQSEIFNISSSIRLNINEIVNIFARKYSFEIKHGPEDYTTEKLHLNSQRFNKLFQISSRVGLGKMDDSQDYF